MERSHIEVCFSRGVIEERRLRISKAVGGTKRSKPTSKAPLVQVAVTIIPLRKILSQEAQNASNDEDSGGKLMGSMRNYCQSISRVKSSGGNSLETRLCNQKSSEKRKRSAFMDTLSGDFLADESSHV